MFFKTTEEHEELRAKVREFVETEVKPIAFELDQDNKFPEEAIKKFAKMGMMGLPYPKEYGGAGKDILSYAIRSEEHTSELQSRQYLVCRLLLEKKKKKHTICSLLII